VISRILVMLLNTIIHIIICTALLELLVLPFILNKKQLSIILFNSLIIVLTLLPELLSLNHIPDVRIFSYLQMYGIALFPISFALIINYFIFSENKIKLIPVLIISLIFLLLAILSKGNSLIILSIMLLGNILYAIYTIARNISLIKIRSHFVLGGLIVQIVLILIALYSNRDLYMILSIGAVSVFTILLSLINDLSRASIILSNLKKTKELNKQLICKVSRLSQKTERLRRIIQQKDVELLQMSKHASLAEITAGIAHELTQPLSGIKCISQNMIDDINYDEFDNLEAVSDLSKICALVDKTSSIINHIRNFSKKSTIAMQFIDINKVILNALDLINLQFKKNNIEIILKLDDNLKKIYGDKIALEQLLINLLLNARDAITGKRKVDDTDFNGCIQITTQLDHEKVYLIIEDNGIGISQDLLKNIWSPFFTTKKRSNGTGIGLSISNKILKEHNGEISIDSQHGVGTKFTIYFPIKRKNVIAIS
jgi:signal transduction histidine kinase